ncbi:MAG: LTA synthase family protein [Sedimentisphaerales bacterium]|nr:LTA synthase family protein [Sedimentisphaerales bacterium]
MKSKIISFWHSCLPVRPLVKLGLHIYGFLAGRPWSTLIFGGLFCTLAVKLFHAVRTNIVSEYPRWVLADIAVLFFVENVLTMLYSHWHRKSVARAAIAVSAIFCTWSVINAGWMIKTGTQILPMVLAPLFRDPLNTFSIIGVSIVKMPVAALILLAPSALALTFFISVFTRPKVTQTKPKFLIVKSSLLVLLIAAAFFSRNNHTEPYTSSITFEGLQYNCHLKAITVLFLPNDLSLDRADLVNSNRKIPAHDEFGINLSPGNKRVNKNLVIVILEGVQYQYTSLANKEKNLTPYLARMAKEGVEFTNVRSTLTHTTKAVFSLLTGWFPSVRQDLAEAVPAHKPYAGLAAILKDKLNFRTAFFQSAKGNFEGRPGLVYNLGFDKFWARDDLGRTDCFLGYLACDEFSMLEPIFSWIKTDESPFFLTVLCSVTHDPYEVPEWYSTAANTPLLRYKQAVSYTDGFIIALNARLSQLNLLDETIFCVISDHGEAFGEHGLLGHERIGFDEALHIPWVIRAPMLIEGGLKVTQPVSSIDLTPTILSLLGFEVKSGDFNGTDVLSYMPDNREVYFSGWLEQSPSGFVKGDTKFIFNPVDKTISVFDLDAEPLEAKNTLINEKLAQAVAKDIGQWRKSTLFNPAQEQIGHKILFGHWLCSWKNNISKADYKRFGTE